MEQINECLHIERLECLDTNHLLNIHRGTYQSVFISLVQSFRSYLNTFQVGFKRRWRNIQKITLKPFISKTLYTARLCIYSSQSTLTPHLRHHIILTIKQYNTRKSAQTQFLQWWSSILFNIRCHRLISTNFNKIMFCFPSTKLTYASFILMKFIFIFNPVWFGYEIYGLTNPFQ